MITNDRQYKIVKSQIVDLETSLNDFDKSPIPEDIHPTIWEAQKGAMLFQLSELTKEVEEYEALKEGKILITSVKALSELPIAIIQARIANNLTQGQLAEILGLKEQQIQRYEAEKYDSASLKTLLKVAEALNVEVQADIQLKSTDSLSSDIRKYPFRQMFNRHWFPNFKGTLNEGIQYADELLASLFENAGSKKLENAFNKRSIRSGSTMNEFALEAWYARIMSLAKDQDISAFFDKSVVTELWLHELVTMSVEDDGPIRAIEFLKSAGIRVVIEPHLEGTFLDGAALLMDDLYPVIGLTLRHDRLDNFWFVLFHELAHVLLHLNYDLEAIFDDLDTDMEGIEAEADQFALNALIPDPLWKRSIIRFSPTVKGIINQAKTIGVHPALVAGRIRRETGKYYQFNELIGQGEVRKLFYP